MTNTETTLLSAIIGGIIGIAGTYFGAIRIMRKQEFYKAASQFRSTVHCRLNGFYPIDQPWTKKDFSRLLQSINKINIAAANFKPFTSCKADFDKAVSEYNKYCRDNTEDKVFVLDYPESMPGGKSTKDYMEEFGNIVKHLLSFTNEK
jgi:hypothetical protein